MKQHIESIHSKVTYSCDQCVYKATWKSSLKTHIESIHSKVTYSCDHCGYKATHKLEETLQLKQNPFKFSGFHVMYVKLCFAVRAIKRNTFITNSNKILHLIFYLLVLKILLTLFSFYALNIQFACNYCKTTFFSHGNL